MHAVAWGKLTERQIAPQCVQGDVSQKLRSVFPA
jgi:hypothetical protein